MRSLTARLPLLLALASLLAWPVEAETAKPKVAKPSGSKVLGKTEDWTAVTYKEGGQTVCYAFTRAQTSTPALPGRGEVVLTVTERPGGRDAVAISAGFAFAANATVTVNVESAALDFYTAQRSAFARDGRGTVQTFLKGTQAVARAPGPKGAVTDTFSLKGFTSAYAAITKACPPGGKPAA